MQGIPTQSAEDLQSRFLNLLVTQLKNQNPLEPMKNSQMTSQLSQLSQLDQLESLNNSFQKILERQQLTQSTDLIGKEVATSTQNGGTSAFQEVEGVRMGGDGIQVRTESGSVALANIAAVREAEQTL